MTVAEMQRRMSAREFTEWQIIHAKFAPIGQLRCDLRAGKAISPLLNLLRSVLMKLPKMSQPSDWIIDFNKPPESMSMLDMRKLLKAQADSYKIPKSERSQRGRR